MIFKYFAAALLVVLPCNALELQAKACTEVSEDATMTVATNNCSGGVAEEPATADPVAAEEAPVDPLDTTTNVQFKVEYFYVRNTASNLVWDTVGASNLISAEVVLAEAALLPTQVFRWRSPTNYQEIMNTFTSFVIESQTQDLGSSLIMGGAANLVGQNWLINTSANYVVQNRNSYFTAGLAGDNVVGSAVKMVSAATTSPSTIWTIDYLTESEYQTVFNGGANFYIVHTASGLVVGSTSNGRSNSSVIELQTMTGEGGQFWQVLSDGSIMNPYCGLVLNSGKSLEEGNGFILYSNEEADYEKWALNTDGNIVNPGTDLVMSFSASAGVAGTPLLLLDNAADSTNAVWNYQYV